MDATAYLPINDPNYLLQALANRIEEHTGIKNATQAAIDGLAPELTSLKISLSKELEERYVSENARLQAAADYLKGAAATGGEALTRGIQVGKSGLLFRESYSLAQNPPDSQCLYGLKVSPEVLSEWIDLRCPTRLEVTHVTPSEIHVNFYYLNLDEEKTLIDKGAINSVVYEAYIWKEREGEMRGTIAESVGLKLFSFPKEAFNSETAYMIRIRATCGGIVSEWSEAVRFATPEYGKCWTWREHTDNIKYNHFTIDKETNRIAKNDCDHHCTVVGKTPLSTDKASYVRFTVTQSKYKDSEEIYAGIAPYNVDQNYNFHPDTYGWYYDCFFSGLRAGKPYNYRCENKPYGPKNSWGKVVREGDTVGILFDPIKREISFVVNGVNFGVAYENIPIDVPLVPSVVTRHRDDTVTIDVSEFMPSVTAGIPQNIRKKASWDSISLEWDPVKGATFYQIEVDGGCFLDISVPVSFTKHGFFPETEHVFRVRTVKGNEVSEWSDPIMGQTKQACTFSELKWRESINNTAAVSIDKENHRVVKALNLKNGYSIAAGNTPIPLNTVVSWSIIMKTLNGTDGEGINVGVAPSDINPSIKRAFEYGWFIYCPDLGLWSGPPHNYRGRRYTQNKKSGEYIHEGDSVGIIFDTTQGDLSYVINGLNYTVAYERIPLDKPLVPCVLLTKFGTSVELDLAEVPNVERVNKEIHPPSNITTKSETYGTIKTSWDPVEDASFYQVEIEGSKTLGATADTTYTRNGLKPGEGYLIRVRTVKGTEVSEWSAPVKEFAEKKYFERCGWKECPDYVSFNKKYILSAESTRIALKINNNEYTTVIGSAPLPFNKVAAWNINILKTDDNGDGIFVGVAPFDIDQNTAFMKDHKYGWYIDCGLSELWSGPPQNYVGRKYGPKKKEGRYVRTGDSVGVVVDTSKGNISYIFGGKNLGVAYEGIPLDKPLVPCVVFIWFGDMIEISTGGDEGYETSKDEKDCIIS